MLSKICNVMLCDDKIDLSKMGWYFRPLCDVITGGCAMIKLRWYCPSPSLPPSLCILFLRLYYCHHNILKIVTLFWTTPNWKFEHFSDWIWVGRTEKIPSLCFDSRFDLQLWLDGNRWSIRQTVPIVLPLLLLLLLLLIMKRCGSAWPLGRGGGI